MINKTLSIIIFLYFVKLYLYFDLTVNITVMVQGSDYFLVKKYDNNMPLQILFSVVAPYTKINDPNFIRWRTAR